MEESVDLFDVSPPDTVKRKIKHNTKVKKVINEISPAEPVAVKAIDPMVATLIEGEKRKNEIEQSAWKELENAFGQKKKCNRCAGKGIILDSDNDLIDCPVCMGVGAVNDVNMRAIELVLSPKYPKTNLNLNASLDGATPDSLVEILGKILT